MSSAFVAAGLLWFVVFVYAVAGSVDFGATFWKMVFARRGLTEAVLVAEHYVSPLWEATNVFLVLIVVGLVGFFPGAAFAYGNLLLLPGSLILILLALRGAALGYGYGVQGASARWLVVVSGLTAVLLPALLVSVLPVSQGGFAYLRAGAPVLDVGALLTSPTAYAYLAFGLASGLFVSAAFLADYAHTAGSAQAYEIYRRQAYWSGPVMLIAGVAALFLIPSASWLQPRLQQQWPWFVTSLVAFAGALALLGPARPGGAAAGPAGRPRWAVVLVGLQLALADVGYGLAHAPYLLYPQVPTASAFSNQAMFSALLWVVLIGLAVLAPGFVWLWRLFVVDVRYTRR